ncbi:sulfotransferase [Roseovarius lutimaris]|nr:sulfotransferase [Roseovarius lutimaris]
MADQMTRDIILHVGLPKTGTTSLQNTLYTDRHRLLEHSYYYDTAINAPHDPKHQWVLRALRKQQADPATDLQRLPRSARTIILSTESISNELLQFEPQTIMEFSGALQEIGELKLLVFLRDPAQWARSYYKQAIINQSSNLLEFYCTSLTFDEFAGLEQIQFLTDHAALLARLESRFRAEVISQNYDSNMVERFYDRFLPLAIPPKTTSRKNSSLDDTCAEVMRQINSFISTHAEKCAWSFLFQVAGVSGSTTFEALAAKARPSDVKGLDISALDRLVFCPNPPLQVSEDDFQGCLTRLRQAAKEIKDH